MRILFVIGSLGAGGAERQLICLANGLSLRGHDVTIVTIFPGGHYEHDARSIATVRVTSLIEGQKRGSMRRLIQLATALWKLHRLIRHLKPNCVYSMLHLSNLYAWLATMGMYRSRLVWGYRASNMRLNWKRLLPEQICKRVSPSVPLMIANSKAGALYAYDDRGFRPKRLAVVANGIDIDLFRETGDGRNLKDELAIDQSTMLVGIVGRIDPMKGHECFLRAAEHVSARQPNTIFVIVGDGARNRVEALKRLASTLGIASRVRWLGNRSDMPKVYSGIDVLVSSSSYGEGFPNVIAEAMACKTPCVVTNVGDSHEIVDELGAVVAPGDYDALARSILVQLSATGRTDRERLRARICEKYSVDAFVKSTEDLIQELVSDS